MGISLSVITYIKNNFKELPSDKKKINKAKSKKSSLTNTKSISVIPRWILVNKTYVFYFVSFKCKTTGGYQCIMNVKRPECQRKSMLQILFLLCWGQLLGKRALGGSNVPLVAAGPCHPGLLFQNNPGGSGLCRVGFEWAVQDSFKERLR